jgi:hypothetical protein
VVTNIERDLEKLRDELKLTQAERDDAIAANAEWETFAASLEAKLTEVHDILIAYGKNPYTYATVSPVRAYAEKLVDALITVGAEKRA